jgi:hypothetical protein
MKKQLLTLGLGFMVSFTAFAENKGGLFLEPMLTYETGNAEVDLPQPFGSSDSSIDGFGIGARLGFHVLESVFIGIDGRYSKPNYENNDTDINSDASAYNYGPVLGFQMPTDLGIRVWAGYIAGAQMDVEEDHDVDLKFKDGNGYRVGAGIKLAMISLNLEYQQIKYNETELNNAGIFSGSTNNVDQTNDSYIFSVSCPISL